MTKILSSKKFADNLIEKIKEEIDKFKIDAKLSIIRFGNDQADLAYEKGIKRSAEKTKIKVDVNELDENESQENLLKLIDKLNKDETVGGILVYRPLPDHIDTKIIDQAIDPKKDIDCMNPINKAKVYSGQLDGFIPLAPLAAVKLLEFYGYDLESKDCLIINHSDVVGKPLAMLLLANWASVSICHVKTKDLKSYTKKADIIFTAMGKAEMLDKSYFSKNSTIIDIGLSKNDQGKLAGDLDEKDVTDYVEAYSPVPGGVGSITNLLLLKNVLKFYKNKK